MDSFSKFFTNHRHRRGFTDHDKHYSRKSLNLVPDYVKTDTSKNNKIELLKKSKGKKTCDSRDLTYIRDIYKVVPLKDKVKRLGSTGIKLYYDKNLNSFVLEK
jgi:hypothetical protein|tara:strand:+ start:1533 stop:1841 length:309 start_codon:yes stop_codon:yes gene_type:complete